LTKNTGSSATNERAPNTPLPELSIGNCNVSEWLISFRYERRIGLQNRAEFVLRKDVVDAVILDYTGEVTLVLHWNNEQYKQYFGLIEFAQEDEETLKLLCQSSSELNDQSILGLLHENVSTFEIIYTISRAAGYSEDQLVIDGMDTLLPEEIEVVVPILGIEVGESAVVGDFRLIPHSDIAWAREGWTEQGPGRVGEVQRLVDALYQGGALMRGVYTGRSLFEAEQQGLRDAELLAAWLGTRLSFRTASLPTGKIQPYNRTASGIRPTRGDIVAVRGLTSSRKWLRAVHMGIRARTTPIPICKDWYDEPPLAINLSRREREAILAFWRSLDVTDRLSSVISLWDAIEFYVGGITVPGLFAEPDLRRLKSETPAWLSPDQRRRYQDVLSGLNSAPLIPRLRAALERDRVPMTADEFELLHRLRRIRNPAQHGRERKMPSREDLRRAWSIVSRMLVYRSFRIMETAMNSKSDKN
jgi:hypothetical protein